MREAPAPALTYLDPAAPGYPAGLSRYLGGQVPVSIAAWGNLALLRRPGLALFGSVQCPGSLILRTHDLAQTLRQAGAAVISGFHSPLEQECLTVLLRGSGPLIICPARSLSGLRLPAAWRDPLSQGRLLLLSPFVAGPRRSTAASAGYRNRFVAALASRIFIAHAAPGGKTTQFCRELLSWGQPVYTFGHAANAHLVEMGVRSVERAEMMG